MRDSEFLDNEIPKDLQTDKDGKPYRMVKGKKIYQDEKQVQPDKVVQTSGMLPYHHLGYVTRYMSGI